MGLVGMFPNNMLMGVAGGGTLWLLTGDTTSMEGDVEEDLAFPIIWFFNPSLSQFNIVGQSDKGEFGLFKRL